MFLCERMKVQAALCIMAASEAGGHFLYPSTILTFVDDPNGLLKRIGLIHPMIKRRSQCRSVDLQALGVVSQGFVKLAHWRRCTRWPS
ncbi:hypothetical protein CPB83DRAFT_865557 [Crepidotus variabilis]|uniref:Uncharacterized protein n=1 Tax=Crepidotus variabilis TaxID=179855 RepID=A0A9P6BCN2_9AGAR|nr:hypothetical protein CPB83DRAFT_865580 [Crepidotus variabilis]KAF9521322.1 hypothetical protein CPB83DRAFT_865557 [Crepidotus variabilis]